MASSSRTAQGAIVVSLVGVIGLAALYGRWVWADSGSFALVLFGAPLACTTLALWVERASRTVLAPAVVAVLAAVPLAWSLVTAGGVGLGFLGPSLLLLLAATVSCLHRSRRGPSASVRT